MTVHELMMFLMENALSINTEVMFYDYEYGEVEITGIELMDDGRILLK